MHNRAGGQTVLLPFNETESREPNERRATIEATRKSGFLHNKNERIADIGSDHAYLPCFAVKIKRLRSLLLAK